MSFDLSTWPTDKLKWELEKARQDLRDDREDQESLPWSQKDGSILEADSKWIYRLEAELDSRGWK